MLAWLKSIYLILLPSMLDLYPRKVPLSGPNSHVLYDAG